MAHTILFTGATGMVGQALVPLLANRNDVEAIFALVHKSDYLFPPDKVCLVSGDITVGPDLAIRPEVKRQILDRVTVIVHAAADTRFSAVLDEARAVNLRGAETMLAFAAMCPRLRAIVALSTVHVAGRRTGTILEEELHHACGFVNAYEQSKYEAELRLRERMKDLPISVLRLSTVLGRSTDGDVARMAAIHHALRLCYTSLAPMIPGVPDGPVDLIAVDYVAAAAAQLAIDSFQAGRTFHICGGQDVLTIDELLGLTLKTFLRYRPSWRKRMIEMPAVVDLPTFELFARSVDEIGDNVLRNSVAIIRHFVPQLAYPKRFADDGCLDSLGKAGISRPRVREFCPNVIRWLVENDWGKRKIGAETTGT